MESKTYWKCVTYPERIDYVGYQNNELVFVLAVEQLLELEVPTKAKWMRMLLCELNRIHSHLVYLGTSALELGAISMFWYCFRERETILDLFEIVTGPADAHPLLPGRRARGGHPARASIPECRKFVEWMPHALDDYLGILDRNEIWLERTKGVGVLSGAGRDRARADRPEPARLGRRLGSPPRRSRTSTTTRSTSACRSIRTATSTPATACAWTRWRSRARSSASASTSSSGWTGMPWIADDRKVVLPPREELHTSMESPHPPLQDRHRGLPRPGGRDLRRRSSRRAASRAATSSRTAGRSRGASTSARRRSSRSRRRRRASHDTLVADLIAVVGSLDAVMGDTDR